MADAPGTATAAAGPDSPKKRAGRQKLIVGGTVVLIVLTYLILRRSSAASSTTSSTVAPGIDPTTGIPYSEEYGGYGYGGGTGYGTTAGSNYLNPQDPTILALQGQLSGLQAQIAGLPSGSTASGGTVAATGGSGSAAQGNPTPGTGFVPPTTLAGIGAETNAVAAAFGETANQGYVSVPHGIGGPGITVFPSNPTLSAEYADLQRRGQLVYT